MLRISRSSLTLASAEYGGEDISDIDGDKPTTEVHNDSFRGKYFGWISVCLEQGDDVDSRHTRKCVVTNSWLPGA